MSDKPSDKPDKPSDIGLLDEPEPPVSSPSAPSAASVPSVPSVPTVPSVPSVPSIPPVPLAPSTSTSSKPPSSATETSESESQEEETTPTATNPDPLAASLPSAFEVNLSDDLADSPIAETHGQAASGSQRGAQAHAEASGPGQVRAAFRSASWKSVTPEFTAPLPFQNMIIVEEFDVEGPQWSGKAWQMVTTTATDPTSWYYAGELVFQGLIRGRKGKAVFRSMGSVSTADGLDGTLELIPETASDELAGLQATGKCKEKEVAPHLPIRYTLTLS